MIIVEGPDGGGKTTLLKDLVKRLQNWTQELKVSEPVKVIHSPGPLKTGLFKWATEALDRVVEPVIFDRFPYFSESIYGPLLRHKTLMTEDEFHQLRDLLIERDPLVIYCRPPTSVLAGSAKTMEQMEGVLDNLAMITKCYDRALLYWMGNFRVFHYDFSQPENKELLMTVVDEYIREDYNRGGWM